MHAWLAHHAFFFLLFQLIFQVFIHGCGHALYTKCWNIYRKAGMRSWCKSIYFRRALARLHLSTFSPFPAWLMDPVSLPHWPLLFTPNVHTSPFLVRTHVWAFPIATWVTKWPFRSVTWPEDEKEKWNKVKIFTDNFKSLTEALQQISLSQRFDTIILLHSQVLSL